MPSLAMVLGIAIPDDAYYFICENGAELHRAN